MTGLVLNGLLAVPAVGALVLFGVSRRDADRRIWLALLFSVVTLGWSVWAVLAADPELSVSEDWVGSLGLSWALHLDAIASPLVLLTTLVTACCVLSLLRHPPEGGSRVALAALLLLIEAGVLGAFLASDMLLFFVFFEVALVPMFFVIDQWGDPHDAAGRRRAATRFLVFTVLGSAVMLLGFLLARGVTGSFSVFALADVESGTPALSAGAALVALGLAVKVPVWPLHIWLPDAHAKAPTVGSVVLAALLLKLGTYGLIRFWLPMASVDLDPRLVVVLATFAVVGIVYGSLACLAQTDLKRLVAYSSVGHMGFVVLAVTTFSVGGVQAAVLGSVAHGVVTGLLFFLAGAVKDRYGHGALGSLRGLYAGVPRLAGLTAFAAVASLGLPGLAGFWGEALTVRAAFDVDPALPGPVFAVLGVVAAAGVVLTAVYFLALMRSALQGDATPRHRDVTVWEWATWSPFVALTVLLGVLPGPVLGPVAAATTVFLGWSA